MQDYSICLLFNVFQFNNFLFQTLRVRIVVTDLKTFCEIISLPDLIVFYGIIIFRFPQTPSILPCKYHILSKTSNNIIADLSYYYNTFVFYANFSKKFKKMLQNIIKIRKVFKTPNSSQNVFEISNCPVKVKVKSSARSDFIMSILPSIWALNAFKTVDRVCSVSNSFSLKNFACFSLHEIILVMIKTELIFFSFWFIFLFRGNNILKRSLLLKYILNIYSYFKSDFVLSQYICAFKY